MQNYAFEGWFAGLLVVNWWDVWWSYGFFGILVGNWWAGLMVL